LTKRSLALNPGADFDIKDDKLYIIGNFTQIEGYLRRNIACIDLLTDTIITSFNPNFDFFIGSAACKIRILNDEILVFASPYIYVIKLNNEVVLFNYKTSYNDVYLSGNNIYIVNKALVLSTTPVNSSEPSSYFEKYNINGALDINFSLSANGSINDFVINNVLTYKL
jgi:hypothetical protein